MIIRELRPDEFHRLSRVPEFGDNVPHPQAAHVAIAEDEGEIVGFWCVQLGVQAEPVLIVPSHRGGLLVHRLFECVKAIMKRQGIETYYIHAESEEVCDYLDRLGLTRTDFVTYEGKVD